MNFENFERLRVADWRALAYLAFVPVVGRVPRSQAL